MDGAKSLPPPAHDAVSDAVRHTAREGRFGLGVLRGWAWGWLGLELRLLGWACDVGAMKLSREKRRLRKSYSRGPVPAAVFCGYVTLRWPWWQLLGWVADLQWAMDHAVPERSLLPSSPNDSGSLAFWLRVIR